MKMGAVGGWLHAEGTVRRAMALRWLFFARCLGNSGSAKPRQLPACTSGPINKNMREDQLIKQIKNIRRTNERQGGEANEK